jgi:hypothetical protein
LTGVTTVAKRKKREERALELEPPLAGISENMAFEQKPPFTSPVLMNMRAYDPDEVRARMGQRPGTVKAYDTQVRGDYPIVVLTSVTNTFIPVS